MESERARTRDDRDYGLSFKNALRDCLNSAIITVNHDGLVTSFSAHAEKLTHLRSTQVLNHPVKSLPGDLRQIIQKTFDSGRPIEDQEISLGNGGLRVSAFPSTDHGKIAVTIVLNDLGPVEKLERNMGQVDRLASVGALSASMAHEIKNALVAVRTFVDTLVKENKNAELAGIVSKEMRRIDSIVSQMLRLAGPAKPTFAAIHVHAVLEHALHLVEHQLTAKKLRARREFGARTDVVLGDEYQLQQAFLNLFFNAIEAMKPGGELSVQTEAVAKPRGLRVSVSDTGVGIPAENLGRLFDAFFTTKQHGTGLGLPITRRIIEEHKGTIGVDSQPNHGTTFQVRLPV